MLRPQDDAVCPQVRDVRRHQRPGTRHHERQEADPRGQVDDRLGFPAQQASVEVGLVAVGRNVAQVHELGRLGVHDCMEVRARPLDRVVVDRQV